jgi:hypothetical protein
VRRGLLIFLLLAAFFALALAACSPPAAPLVAWHSVNYPTDAGAPPRKLESWSHIGVEIDHMSFDDLAERGAYAYTMAPEAGSSPICFITMPSPWEVSVFDYDRLLAHEMRHCAGQLHRIVVSGDAVVNVWLP